jgi:hypothetical protein
MDPIRPLQLASSGATNNRDMAGQHEIARRETQRLHFFLDASGLAAEIA